MIYLLNKLDEQLIENIKAELGRRNWRPAELARRTGLTPMKISRVLNEAQWDSDVISRIAESFGRTPASLLEEKQPKKAIDTEKLALLDRLELFRHIAAFDDPEISQILISVRMIIKNRENPDLSKQNKNQC